MCYPNALEVCDNKDNNCNGQVDEAWSKTLNCPCGCGGTYREDCTRGVLTDTKAISCPSSYNCMDYSTCRESVSCSPCTSAPSDEWCDSRDNDCDGTVDMADFDCFCSDIMMKCGHKIGAPDGSVVDYDVCSEDGSKSCCANNKDCVSGGVCYRYVRGMNPPFYNIQGNELVCSVGVWCPKGFTWDMTNNKCVPARKSCFPDPCTFPDPLTPEWFASTGDMGCILNPTAQNMACCITTTIAGVNFYNWAPHKVY